MALTRVTVIATAKWYSTTLNEMFTGTSKYQVGSGSMCVLLALLLCSVIQRWHGVGFTAMCTQCARSAHAVQTLCPSFCPFSQVFGSVPGFFWLPKHLGCGIFELSTIFP